MTKAALRKTIRALPILDRIDLYEELGLSIAKDKANIPFQDWQRSKLADEIGKYDQDPADVITLDEFKAKTAVLKRQLKERSRVKRKSQ